PPSLVSDSGDSTRSSRGSTRRRCHSRLRESPRSCTFSLPGGPGPDVDLAGKEDPAMRATAAILYEENKPLVVEDVDVLEPGPNEVLVRFAANGVCHSDLHVMTGDYPHPLPVVLGHEAAGIVEKAGSAVASVKAGDHICTSYIPSCG